MEELTWFLEVVLESNGGPVWEVHLGGAQNFACFDSYFKIMGNKYLNWTFVKYNLGLSHGRVNYFTEN